MGGKKNSQSTQATQTTHNTDASLNADNGSTVLGEGARQSITINDLSADVAGYALDVTGQTAYAAMAATAGLAESGLDLSAQTTAAVLANNTALTETAFDKLADAGTQVMEFNTAQARATDYARMQNQDLSADLARRAFALADPVADTNEKITGLARIGLYVASGLLGLFLLLQFSKKKPA